MDSTIIAGIIGAVASIIVAVIIYIAGPIVVKKTQEKRFPKKLERENIPNILGDWKTKWYIGNELLHEGSAKLHIGERYYRIEGSGTSPGRTSFGYSICGEVYSSRLFVMTYKSSEFPTVAYIGVAILTVSTPGDSMEGNWAGRADGGNELQTGRVVWSR